jgi:hypothetical protein
MSNNFDGRILLDDVDAYLGWGRTDTPGIDFSFGPRIDSIDFDPSAIGHAAPLGSLSMQRALGQLWLKDGVLDTDWTMLTGGVPPIVGTQYCFVWRPGLAVDFENVYGAWADLYTAADSIQGRKLVVLDASELGPFSMTLGGPVMEQFDFVVLGSEELTISIDDSWTSLPASISGPSRWEQVGAAVLFSATSAVAENHRMLLKDGVTLFADTIAMFELIGTGALAGEGPILTLTLDRDCSILGVGQGGVAPIDLTGTSSVTLLFGENCGNLGEIVTSDADPAGSYSATWRADAAEATSSISSVIATAVSTINVPKRTRTFGAIAAATALDSADLLVDVWEVTAAAPYTITLPDADPNFEDVEITFKLIDAGVGDASVVTLSSASIDGGTTFLLNFQDSVTIVRNGSVWRVISAYVA